MLKLGGIGLEKLYRATLKQTATATTTTAVMDAESWRKYVTVARQIIQL